MCESRISLAEDVGEILADLLVDEGEPELPPLPPPLPLRVIVREPFPLAAGELQAAVSLADALQVSLICNCSKAPVESKKDKHKIDPFKRKILPDG